MQTKRLAFLIIVMTVGLMTGCIGGELDQADSAEHIEEASKISATEVVAASNPVSPTPIPTTQQEPSAEATVIVTATTEPSTTPTPQATSALRPTETATWAPTPLPTVPPEQREPFIRALLETNGGCELPCWWGAIPGETTWADHMPFLASFADATSGAPSYEFDFLYKSVPEGDTFQIYSFYAIRDGIIEGITSNDPFTDRYRLPQLLAKFGPPDEVWVFTDSNSYGGGPFYVNLVYDMGIIALYGAFTAAQQGDKIFACIGDTSPSLILGEANSTFIENQKERWLTGLPYRPVEEALGMTVDEFHAHYSDTASPVCLSTPIDLWPPI